MEDAGARHQAKHWQRGTGGSRHVHTLYHYRVAQHLPLQYPNASLSNDLYLLAIVNALVVISIFLYHFSTL